MDDGENAGTANSIPSSFLTEFRGLLRGSFWYTFGGMLSRVVAIVLIPLYTHFLSPTEYGIIGITTMVTSLVIFVVAMGLPEAVMRFYVDVEHDSQERKSFLTSILFFQLFFCGGIAIFLSLFGGYLFNSIIKDVPFSPYVILGIWSGYFQAIITTVPLQLFRIRQQSLRYVVFNTIFLIITTGLTIYFVVIKQQGALGSLKGTLYSSIVVSIILIASIRESLGWSFSVHQLRRILVFSLPLLPQGIFFWLMGLSDRAILGAHVELAEVGVYTLAYQFALIIQVVNLAVDGSWRAFLFRAVNDLKKHLWIQRLATYYVVGIAFVGWGIAVFGVDVIKLATPVSYHRAILVLPFLCLATYLLVFYQIWSDGVLAIKNTKGLPIIAMIAALLGVTLNLLLIPRYGIFAAALNSIIMYSTLAACAYFLASKLNLLSYEYVRWVKVTLVAIVLGLIAYHLSLGSELLDILAKFGLIFIWPFFLYLIGFWTEQEVIAIKAALSRLLHGSWSNSRS